MGLGKNISFVSQREQEVFLEDSCHVACLKMLLEFINHVPLPSYKELCFQLKLADYKVGDYDSSLEEVVRYIVKCGINFRLIFRRHEWEGALNTAPIMVGMQGGQRFWGKEGHAIVLIKFENNTLTYLDPWFSSTKGYTKTINIEDFYKHFVGFACQLLP